MKFTSSIRHSLKSLVKPAAAKLGARQAEVFDGLSPSAQKAKRICEMIGFDLEKSMAANDEFALKRFLDERPALRSAVMAWATGREDSRVAEAKARHAEAQARYAELKQLEQRAATAEQTFGMFSREFSRFGLPAITSTTSPDALNRNLDRYLEIAKRDHLMKLGLLSPDDVRPPRQVSVPSEVTGLDRTKTILEAKLQLQS